MKNFLNLYNYCRNRLILFLVFLFPILIATVEHAASTIFFVLVAFSLFYCKQGWKVLRPGEKRFFIGFGVFVLMSSLSLFMTEDLRHGIQRLERYVRLVYMIPIYFMFRVERIETGKAFLSGAFVAVFVMLGQALYQVEVLNKGVAHGAYHKIIMGNMAILNTTLIFIGALFYGKKRAHYVLAALAISAGFYASLLSGTRTAWLFVPVIVVCLLWLYRRELSRKGWKRIFLGIGFFILLIGGLQPERLTQGLAQGWDDLKTFQEDPSRETSWGLRLIMWRNSILIFKDSPLLGTGIGDFKNDSKKLLQKGLSYQSDFAINQSNAHNLYFQLLAEGGLVGLLTLVVVLFVLPFIFLHELWQKTSERSVRFYALSGLIGVFAFAWFGMSSSWVNRNPVITTYCLMMLVFLSSAAIRTEGKPQSDRDTERRFSWVIDRKIKSA